MNGKLIQRSREGGAEPGASGSQCRPFTGELRELQVQSGLAIVKSLAGCRGIQFDLRRRFLQGTAFSIGRALTIRLRHLMLMPPAENQKTRGESDDPPVLQRESQDHEVLTSTVRLIFVVSVDETTGPLFHFATASTNACPPMVNKPPTAIM